MTGTSEEWVEIGTTVHPDEAVAWRDLLSSTGIRVRLNPDIDMVDMYPGTSVMGPYRLLVPANIESEARAALEDIRNSPTDDEESS